MKFNVSPEGKEAVVLHATGGNGNEHVQVSQECAVKVMKTTLNDFKTRERYIKNDYRFRDRYSKQNPRKIVHLWAEKEFHNLTIMYKANIRAPTPFLLKKHVLVMQFIGMDGKPAPKLKEAELTEEELLSAYSQCVDMMKRLYSECRLVHGDLSEFNLLQDF